ncbi:MAG: N-acetylmuramoyl-L-alanine amidase [Planctomycetota bacterium]
MTRTTTVAAALPATHPARPRALFAGNLALLTALLCGGGSVGCASSDEALAPEVVPKAINQSIMACGERLFVGAPVVLWNDPLGYSAYETDLHFERPPVGTDRPNPGELRYRPGRVDRRTEEVMVRPEKGTMEELREALDLFVVHYDVCGVSQTCFKVLHDRRGLSVHFMLDVDGTIYQTLDLRDTAWHASQTNDRSVGIEIAQIGAYPRNEKGDATLAGWYEETPEGTRLTLPKDPGELGVLTPGFQGRPARDAKILGRIQGEGLQQYDFTPEQYDSLVKLTAALCHHFPRIQPDAPRDPEGRVLDRRLDEEAEWAFQGILGHYHVSSRKVDPGPAFDWQRFLARVRARLSALTTTG